MALNAVCMFSVNKRMAFDRKNRKIMFSNVFSISWRTRSPYIASTLMPPLDRERGRIWHTMTTYVCACSVMSWARANVVVCLCVCGRSNQHLLISEKAMCRWTHVNGRDWQWKFWFQSLHRRLMHSSLKLKRKSRLSNDRTKSFFGFHSQPLMWIEELEFQISPNPTARVMCWHWNEPAYSQSQWNGR